MKRTVSKKAVASPKGRKTRGLLAPTAAGMQLIDGSTHRAAAMERMQKALFDIVESSDEGMIAQALGADTSIDALIRLIGSPGIAAAAAARTNDPLRGARARAVRRQIDLMKAEGGCIGVDEVAERLNMTRAGVDKRRKAGRLLAIDGGSRVLAYPAWQFRDYGVLPGLEEVLTAFVITEGLMKMDFFLTFDPDLGETPLGALRKGKREEVAAAAARFGRFGHDG